MGKKLTLKEEKILKNDLELYLTTELIENTGYWLKQPDPHPHARKLRLMQEKISELSKSSDDQKLIFLDHFLSTYINRLWNNLAIDFTYESGNPGKEILGRLFQDIGRIFTELADALRQLDLKKYYNSLLNLTYAYRKSLLELDKKRIEIQRIKFKTGTILYPETMDPEKNLLYKIIEESGAITQSEYQLAGGAPGNYFFDIDKLLSKPSYVDTVSEYYTKEIKEVLRFGKIEKLAFIEKDIGTVGALPLMSSIISKTSLDGFIIRIWKDISIGKIKGSLNALPINGEHIGIVTDVVTAGKGIEKALEGISTYARERGIEVETPYAFALYHRGQVDKEVFEKNEIDVRVILTHNELERIGFIPNKDEPPGNPRLDEEKMNTIPPAEWKVIKYSKGLDKETLDLEEKIKV